MAGLFSGASTGPALEELGASIGKLGMTIYGKLDEAEATSEYQSGQLRLEKMMNQFDQNLSQDPEYDTWGDKNTKAMSDSWDLATKSVKNPKAFNALNEWWVGQKVSRDKAINNRIIGARIAKLSGALHTNIDETMTSDASVDQKKARIEGLGQAAVATNVADPGAWEDERARLFKTLDRNDLQSKGLDLMNKQGLEAGAEWMLDPQNSQTLNEEERKTVTEAAAQSYNIVLGIKKKKADAENNNSLVTVNGWVASGKIPDDAVAKILGTAKDGNLQWVDLPDAGVNGSQQKDSALKLIRSTLKPDPVTDFEKQWDAAPKQDAATRKGIIDSFNQVPGINSTQKARLNAYLNVKKGGKPTQEDEDAALADWYEKVQRRELDISDSNTANNVLKQIWDNDSYAFGAKQRFSQFIAAKAKQEQADPTMKALYDSYKAPPGSSPEEVDISRKMGLYGAEYFEKHPEITNPKDRENIMNGLHSYFADAYIDDSIVKLSRGFAAIPRVVASWFGADPERAHIADLVQQGDLQEASDAGDTVATAQLKTFTTALGQQADARFPGNAELAVSPRTKGPQKGKQPLYRTLSSDQKTVYELWKIGNDINWYALPAAKAKNYVDIGEKGSDWSQVK
jgi:hypothetical protein